MLILLLLPNESIKISLENTYYVEDVLGFMEKRKEKPKTQSLLTKIQNNKEYLNEKKKIVLY